MEHAFLVDAPIGVGAEVIPLGLEQIRREARLPVAVDVSQRGAEGGAGHPEVRSGFDNLAQALAGFVDKPAELAVHHQVCQVGLDAEGRPDGLEQLGPYDAAAAPDTCDLRELQVVAILLRSATHLRKALRVAGNRGEVECLPQCGDELALISGQLLPRSAQDFRGRHALLFLPGKDASHHRRSERRDGNPQVQCVLRRPFPRPFLFGSVQNEIDQGLPGLRINLAQHDDADFQQERVEFGAVPLREDVPDLWRAQTKNTP